MLKIALSGCNGKMGRTIAELCSTRENMKIVAGFDTNAVKLADFPVYAHPLEFKGASDVLIDFSNEASLASVLSFCLETGTPAVLCTTGYSDEQIESIRGASSRIPVLRSGNMSLGVNLLMEIAKRCAEVLGDAFDVEIIERHHNQKVDAPSGTALMLGDAVKAGLPYEAKYVYDRHTKREKRSAREIGMHSLRGGTIVGEHEIVFAGKDEVIEIRHVSLSRALFATGALESAAFLASCKSPGLYTMSDVVQSK